VDEWKIPYREKRNLYPLNIADGRPIDSDDGMVKYKATVTLTMHSRKEIITLDIINIGSSDLILGMLWLQLYNPYVNWKELILTFLQGRPV
jgi:hypothetical protein